MPNKRIFYLNTVLFFVVVIFAVATFSSPGHRLVQKVVAQIGAISGEGGVNYLARFVSGAPLDPTNTIGNSIIYDSGVNVGIGTTGPDSKLQINGVGTVPNANFDTSVQTLVSTTAAGVGIGPSLRFAGESGNGIPQYTFATINGAKDSSLPGNYMGYLGLFTTQFDGANVERVRIGGNGNVGVGTTNLSYKLTVAQDLNPPSNFHDTGQFVVRGVTNPNRGIVLGSDNTDNYGYLYSREIGVGPTNLVLQPDGGTVGIKTTTPYTGLQIGGGGDGWQNGLTLYSGYPTIYFRDADEQSAMIHVNGNFMYFLSGCGSNDPGSGNNWCLPGGATEWPFRIHLPTGNAYFGRGVRLEPLSTDPPNPANGMMWMLQ